MIIRLVILYLALLSISHAQIPALSQERLPSAPSDLIYDPDSYFRIHPSERQQVSQTIQRIKNAYDFDVYIAVFGIIGQTSASLRAQTLYDHWFGKDDPRDGILFGFDIENRSVSIARRPNASTEDIAKNEKGRIPDHRLSRILNAVRSRFNATFKDATPTVDRADHISTILSLLEEELALEVTPEEIMSDFEPSRPPVLKGLLMSLLVAAPFFVLFLWIKRRITKVRHRYVFPTPDIPKRLGGSNSGGTGASIQFTVKKD